MDYSPAVRKLFKEGQRVMGLEELRPGQPEALEHVLKKRNVLAVMPTGSGKSLLYQLPSLVLPGVTVVVSPLIALIKDQIDKMKALGVAVCRADSTLTVRQKRQMEALAKAPGGKLLFTTPERMAVPEFREFLRTCSGDVGVSLFVVDEAHCVSQWGHDFRPAYLSMRKAREDLGNPPVLATTATAPPHVRDDILHQLGAEDAKIVTTTFDRPNLHYEVIALPGDDDKNKTLVTLLKKLKRPGIVYCATVKMVETLYEKLSRHGIPVTKYHGRLTKKVRDEQQQRFMEKRSDLVMIATNAFGLGVDKSDIRYVLHYHVPGSLEAYAQEAGRGGRDRKPARCVLLFSPDDVAIQEFFLTGTYPTQRQVRQVYKALEAWGREDRDDGAQPTIPNIAVSARVGQPRTRTILSLLKDEKFVIEGDGKFEIADPPPDPVELSRRAKQYEARRIADRQRLDSLLAFVGTSGCRTRLVLEYLGEEQDEDCGRCDNCLRSKDAAEAAALDAQQLERSVTSQLDDELSEEDKKRVVRHRVVRIDKHESSPEAGSSETPAPKTAYLTQAAAELDDGDDDDDDFEDDYEEEDEVIERTAAELAAEGYDLGEDHEITILARKRVPKPPRGKKAKTVVEDTEPKKKRKRRRRKKKVALPPKSAFSSPVLNSADQPNPAPRPTGNRKSAGSGGGPVIEYVRGPMRINMTPVASAAPGDTPPAKKRRRRKPASGGAKPANQPQASTTAAAKPGDAAAPTKRKRRRRRKKRSGEAATNAAGPVEFFASTGTPSNGANGTGKKKRRRRRKRSGGANSNASAPSTD